MKHCIHHVAVVIPARNEEALLPACLQSVLRACHRLPNSVGFSISVAVDASTDQTYQIAKRMLSGSGHVVTTESASAGAARGVAVRSALSGYTGRMAECWLANTDADCRVPEEWLVRQLFLAQAGAEAVAGIVDVDDFSQHTAGVEKLFREGYLIHADGTHPHVHGANLGIRADTYLRAGGWSEHATGEDHDLWKRINGLGCVTLAVAELKVTTSGRRIGRAPAGFASLLDAHNRAVA